MKTMTMKALSLLLLLLNIAYCQGQVIPQEISDIVTNADYIFEGTVIRSDSYWGVQHRTIYTSHTLEIHKIFKGNLTCGTIEVITEGGQVGDIALTISHNLELRVGNRGLFACTNVNYSELPATDYYPETNTDAVEVLYNEQGYFRYFDDEVNREVANLFYDFDSLAQVYDAVQLLTQLNYTDCAVNKPTKKVRKENPKPTHVGADYKKSEEETERLMSPKRKNQTQNKTLLTTTLTYQFENATITGTNPRYLEYDIYLNADDNSSYLDNAQVFITYDTTVFGSNIVTNTKLTTQRGTILNDVSSYQDPDSLKWDVAANVFQIILFGRLNATNRYPITTTATQAIHIKMELTNCKTNHSLSFTNLFAMQQYSYYAPAANSLTGDCSVFPNIVATDVEVCPTCNPYISDFLPKSLNAGVGDILTIQGKYFGATQGTGKVFLKNANDGGLTYTTLDRKDSVSWSDTEIKVRVPSMKDTLGLPEGYKISAGSGYIKVKTKDGDIINTTSLPVANLTILYSYANHIGQNLQYPKKPLSLIDAYGLNIPAISGVPIASEVGGYNFRTKLNNSARAIAGVAINDWVCLTDVHFTLGDSLPNTWTKPKEIYDTINVIQFTNYLPNGAPFAYTRRFEQRALAGIEPFVLEIDIILKDTSAWFFDTSGLPLPAGKWDFYEILLHELGHAHCLEHVNFIDDLMYYSGGLGPAPANKRKIHLNNELGCLAGGQNVIQHSQSSNLFGPFLNTHMQLLTGVNCAPNAIQLSENNLSFTLFPNPSSGLLTLSLSESQSREIKVKLYDISGKSIEIQTNVLSDEVIEMDVSDLIQGIYIVSIASKNTISYQKFIKQ